MDYWFKNIEHPYIQELDWPKWNFGRFCAMDGFAKFTLLLFSVDSVAIGVYYVLSLGQIKMSLIKIVLYFYPPYFKWKTSFINLFWDFKLRMSFSTGGYPRPQEDDHWCPRHQEDVPLGRRKNLNVLDGARIYSPRESLYQTDFSLADYLYEIKI